MRPTARTIPLAVCVAVAVAGWDGRVPVSAVQQFRAGVTLVPIEVRVVDREGRPIRDLQPADFSVSEDGVAREIEHFDAVSVDAPSIARGRQFVVVLGRGRLNEPTKAVQALIDFVREKALPADRFVVVAYLKAIGPTADRESLVRFLERYREGHNAVEAKLVRDGRRGAGPVPVLKPDTRADIQALFAGIEPLRDLAGGSGNALSRYNDHGYLRRTMTYLRTLESEKQVVLLTERAFATPRTSDDPTENYWFRQATSARAALSFIHTGGTPSPRPSETSRFAPPTQLDDIGARQEQRAAATQNGGTSTFFRYAAQPLAALDQATRFHYVVGYYAGIDVASDQYRRVEVTVRRPGAVVLYRRGYQAAPPPENETEYREAATTDRLEAAVEARIRPTPVFSADGPGLRWGMRLTTTSTARTPGGLELAVSFDPWWVNFVPRGDRHVVDIDLLLVATDEQGREVGRLRQRLDLALTDAELAGTRKAGPWLTVDVVLPATATPHTVFGALYQFDTDRVATARRAVPR